MNPLIEQHKQALLALCRRHGVRKLDLFGSATTDTFDAETSDLDFVIDFADYGPGIARRFFDFATDAEALFGRPIDLVFDSEMRCETRTSRQPSLRPGSPSTMQTETAKRLGYRPPPCRRPDRACRSASDRRPAGAVTPPVRSTDTSQ